MPLSSSIGIEPVGGGAGTKADVDVAVGGVGDDASPARCPDGVAAACWDDDGSTCRNKSNGPDRDPARRPVAADNELEIEVDVEVDIEPKFGWPVVVDISPSTSGIIAVAEDDPNRTCPPPPPLVRLARDPEGRPAAPAAVADAPAEASASALDVSA